MTVNQYIENLNQRYKLGNATEHTFRGDLQQLLESLVPEIQATNEPKRQKCGAPDYILTRKDIPVGFIEAKDIGDKDLEGAKKTGNKEQFDRYKASLNNLIFTDYLDFHFYQDGQFITKVSIGAISENKIIPLTENFNTFSNLIQNFCIHISQTIKNSQKLALMMAAKARLLADIIERALLSDEETNENSTLKDQMNAFKQILIHDITPKGFSDVYSQTIAYGMFAARLHDPTLPTFSRQEAAELIPKSNPFLRKLFGYIAGPDLDDRIKWVVDGLVEVFLACNVEELLKNYGKTTKTEDPIIHFYETFLSEYDPKLRKARGVWYTPQPVVNFIVRAVDDILKTEFDLPNGLADKSKTTIKVNLQETDKRYKDNVKTIEQEVHRVQILDPATGTGTFLAEVIKQVHKQFEGQRGIWSSYVEKDLLPRLNGFELLMASYAMAHLKLDLLLTETGFKSTTDQRFKVYLTNSLEESHPDTGTLFANWLSSEANEANQIKRDTPVMCIIGNPPYAKSSTNKSKWIESLMIDYKRNLNEQNIQPLSDDYIKFIRFSQFYIDKSGEGVLAFITNNSFLDGVIHRQMRLNLLESFDKIYIINLHGNSNIQEKSNDGSKDENVFDIQQGVSINLFIKSKKKTKELSDVYYLDLYGIRKEKYNKLLNESIQTINWNTVNYSAPYYFFVPKEFSNVKLYEKGFRIGDLMAICNSGVVTSNDDFTIEFEKRKIWAKVEKLGELNIEEARIHFGLKKDSSDWKLSNVRNDVVTSGVDMNKVIPIDYRPFDIRYTYYTGNSNGFHGRPRKESMRHMLTDNIGLLLKKQHKKDFFSYSFLTTNVIEGCIFESAYARSSIFPLYIYPELEVQQTLDLDRKRTPNLNLEIVSQIGKKIGLEFTPEKESNNTEQPENNLSFAPIDILDYIYAVLHSPTYREKYKEFLKIDFPRVPYPSNKNVFWQLVKLGGELREIHLLNSLKVNKYITEYPNDGTNIVDKIRFEHYLHEYTTFGEEYPEYLGTVFINEKQCFERVPVAAWEFYIGGYQPAQKWLKDRKGRTLDVDDILHYQKIIVALTETIRIMKEIDKIEIE